MYSYDIFRDASKCYHAAVLNHETNDVVCFSHKNQENIKNFFSSASKAGSKICCFNFRTLYAISNNIFKDNIIIDVKYAARKNNELALHTTVYSLVNFRLGKELATKLYENQNKLTAHTTTAKLTGYNPEEYSILQLAGDSFVSKFLTLRLNAIKSIFEDLSEYELKFYSKRVHNLLPMIREMELNGVPICRDKIKSDNSNLKNYEQSFISSIRNSVNLDSRSRFNMTPVYSSTGRSKIESGTNYHSTPKSSECRSLIGFSDGNGIIVSVDFNAMDFRSLLINANDDKLKSLYEGCSDFHLRTTELLGLESEERSNVKIGVYNVLYGGSIDSLRKSMHCTFEKATEYRDKINDLLRSVVAYRVTLCEAARQAGYIQLACDSRIPVSEQDHDGKVLGLSAQCTSAIIFDRMFCELQNRLIDEKMISRIFLTIHDEFLIESNKEELEKLKSICLEVCEKKIANVQYAVKFKSGDNYADAT